MPVSEYAEYADDIIYGAQKTDQRTGQYMFNQKDNPGMAVVRGTHFDPFYKNMDRYQIIVWAQDHLIFDHGRIVAVFNNNEILWEEHPVTIIP